MRITTRTGASQADPERLKRLREARLIRRAKAVAAGRILAVMPEWQQRNATARAVEIVNARLSGTATADDLDELARLQAAFERVKEIRSASDQIEEDIAAGLVTDEAQIRDSERWSK